MTRTFSTLLLAAGLACAAGPLRADDAAPAAPAAPTAEPPQPAQLTRDAGFFMLDYQVVPVPGDKSIDLMGFHVLNRMNDWFSLGIGAYAPLFQGAYGGFMALDMTAHAQRKVYGNFFVAGGVSLGGGGGGRSTQQSKELSGTGGFAKGYLGIGHEFEDFSVGLNYSRITFRRSNIGHSQFNVFAQVPFSYFVGPFGSAGSRFTLGDDADARAALASSNESVLSVGLDNYRQINPRGTRKETINAADLQYSYFMTKDAYWFANAGVGYRGLPLYNQVLGGLGWRAALSPDFRVYAQLGIGSGGYAPEAIDTGPGLLVFPKVSAELMLDRQLGLALSAGYLVAPKASSKNVTIGASLNYHLHAGSAGASADGLRYQGFRIHLFPQLEFGVRSRGLDRPNLKMLTVQLDNRLADHVYLPMQVSIAANAYLGYPGYGELLAGLGAQSRYPGPEGVQFFGQLLAGTNSHGALLKGGLGVNLGLGERTAVYAQAGQTVGINKDKFRAGYVGVGLSRRFSVPNW